MLTYSRVGNLSHNIMSKVQGTIVRTADYEAKSGRTNVAITILGNDSMEYVAHIPKSTLENRGCFVSASIEGEEITVDYYDKGEKSLGDTVVDKDHTLVRGVFIEALSTTAQEMGTEIRQQLAKSKAQEILDRQKDEKALKATARAERLRKAMQGASSAPATTQQPATASAEPALPGADPNGD